MLVNKITLTSKGRGDGFESLRVALTHNEPLRTMRVSPVNHPSTVCHELFRSILQHLGSNRK
jgi:hypothetical protein